MRTELLAGGLGWPEGPCVLDNGDIAFVETYRGQVSVCDAAGRVSQLAYLGGGPNSVIATAGGELAVAQNGGLVGPWRSDDPRTPSIQRVDSRGRVETMATSIDGIQLRAPNDLVQSQEGIIYFTDSGGDFDPIGRKDPGYIFSINRDGTGKCLAEVGCVYPNGILIDGNGDVCWTESYTGQVRRVDAAGRISTIAALPDRSVPDGLKTDREGTFFVAGCASSRIELFAADGRHLGGLEAGRVPTNCAFDGNSLIVTDAGHPGDKAVAELTGSLWRLSDLSTLELEP